MEKKYRVFGNNSPGKLWPHLRFFCLSLLCCLFFTLSACEPSENSRVDTPKTSPKQTGLPIPNDSQATITDKPVRKPAVAGAFYPGDKETLRDLVDNYFRQARPKEVKGPVRLLIAPHAGYPYSGLAAAHAYKTLAPSSIKTVVIICNCHTDFFDGISIFKEGFFETPLGKVEIDSAMTGKLLGFHEKIVERPRSHTRDHTLEVQLPFLQRTLGDFKIVPVLFGTDSPELSQILSEALKKYADDQTLIVASTDMSHYPSSRDARYADQKTIDAILSGDVERLKATLRQLESENIPNAQTFLCGVSGVRTAMLFAKEIGADEIVLHTYTNSGEVMGNPGRSVGYSAITFSKPSGNSTSQPAPLNEEEQQELLKIARQAAEEYVSTGKILSVSNPYPALDEHLGAFVTLKEHGRLRGCIGRFQPDIPLYEVVIQMAIAAATEDRRFLPVQKNELGGLEYEISVLRPLRTVASADEIEIGKHGVQVSKGFRGGVFLPQVATENNWDRDTFLSVLCQQKAGLKADCWKDPSTDLRVFTAQVFSEKE